MKMAQGNIIFLNGTSSSGKTFIVKALQEIMEGYNLLGWTVMPAFWALLVGGLGLLILRVARADTRRTRISTPVEARALNVLGSRYAKGELIWKQFSEMRKNLFG